MANLLSPIQGEPTINFVHSCQDSNRFRRGFRAVSVLFSLTGGLESVGREGLPKHGSFLLLANHVSFVDPFLIATAANQEFHFMVRDDALSWPVIGSMLDFFNGYPVKRGTPDLRALKQTIRLLNSGNRVMLFPEGTRSLDGQLGKPVDGIGFIVKQVDVPVIPAFIGGAERFLPRHSFLPQPAKITISFGQPLDFSHFANEPRREQYKLIGQDVMAAIGDLRFQQGYD